MKLFQRSDGGPSRARAGESPAGLDASASARFFDLAMVIGFKAVVMDGDGHWFCEWGYGFQALRGPG